MRKLLASTALTLAALTGAAHADAPRVATDIAPVHSLVAQVMDGVGTPDLIVEPGASPHGYALRPSQARMLQKADLVIWVGHDLTPWLEKPVETLASKAQMLELLEAEGTHLLAYREEGGHDDHEEDHADEDGHDHEEDHADADDDKDHGHDAKHDHADKDDHHDEHGEHDEHDKHEEHDEGHETAHAEGEDEDAHGHGHHHTGDHDPHAWLDPENGRIWLGLVAETLADIDPENAARYRANAEAAQARLTALQAELDADLAQMRGRGFVAYHDAFQYFETRFGLNLSGTLARGDATDPGPARLAAIRDLLDDENIGCVFTEPQYNPRLMETVTEGRDMRVLVLDPLGADLEPGAALYDGVLRTMGATFAACAAAGG